MEGRAVWGRTGAHRTDRQVGVIKLGRGGERLVEREDCVSDKPVPICDLTTKNIYINKVGYACMLPVGLYTHETVESLA